jgi:hypothetical protein
MSKPTRKQRAALLRERVARGPIFLRDRSDAAEGLTHGGHKPNDAYRVWVETWVLPELDTLIPELKK